MAKARTKAKAKAEAKAKARAKDKGKGKGKGTPSRGLARGEEITPQKTAVCPRPPPTARRTRE